MLTQEEIRILISAHNNHYDSYEDFRFRNYFVNTAVFNESRYNARFDAYFSKLDSLYNEFPRNNHIVHEYIREMNTLNQSIDYNDLSLVDNFLFRKDSLKDIIKVFSNLTSLSINEDLNTNIKGWKLITEKYGVNISTQLDQFKDLSDNIVNSDVFTDLVAQLEKIQIYLYNVLYDFKDINNSSPDNISMNKYIESCSVLKNGLSFFEKYYKNNDILKSLIKENNVFDYINQYKEIRESIVETIKQNTSDFTYSRASHFSNLMNKASDVEIVLLSLNDSDLNQKNKIRHSIRFTDNHSISTLNIFEDNSVAIKNNNGEWEAIHSKIDKDSILENLICRELSTKLKKSPTITRLFIAKTKEYFDSSDLAFIAADTYLENEAILKSKDYNLLEEITDLSFEALDDSMTEFVNKHKIEQYGYSIASKKYKHLYNKESFEIITLLYDLKIPENELQETLGKKLAAFKGSEEFNNALRQLHGIHSGFNVDAVIKKATNYDIEIIKNEDNMLILKIENFKQSSNVGSSSWCITRNESYFKSYKEDANQYFIYNFEKDPTDNDSIVGVTLNKNGTYSAAHLKNDDQLHNNDQFKQFQLDIIKHDLKSYPTLNPELQSKISLIIDNKKQNLLKKITSKLFSY